MTRIIVRLYDQAHRATDVMSKLHDAGFQPSQIFCIEASPEHRHFYQRDPLMNGRGEILAPSSLRQALKERGISADDVDELVRHIRAGQSLVLVESSDELSGRAAHLMDAYPAAEAHTEATQNGSSTAQEDLGSDGRQVSDDEAAAQRRTSRPPEATRRERSAGEELETNAARERFKIYKPDFRRHYEEHYAALRKYPFATYAKAYRYGLALATDRSHRHADWPTMEPEAKEQWRARMTYPWQDFREAVRFGWYRIRGDEEKFSGRPRRL